MGISPDRFVPRQDGSPQSLEGLTNAGRGLGGGLLSGFTGMISGIGQALGSLFTGGLSSQHAFYPIYIGLRDGIKPLVDKNEESLATANAAKDDAAKAATKAAETAAKLEETEETLGIKIRGTQRSITLAANRANELERNITSVGTNLENIRIDLVAKLALANQKAIEALGKSDQALAKALQATNDAVRALQEFTALQQKLNQAQADLNAGFQRVDAEFEKTRVRFLVVPDQHSVTEVTLPGYISVSGNGNLGKWGGKVVTVRGQGNWNGWVAGILKSKNGSADVVSLEIRGGRVVDSSTVGPRGNGVGSFRAGGVEFYVGCLLMVIPEK